MRFALYFFATIMAVMPTIAVGQGSQAFTDCQSQDAQLAIRACSAIIGNPSQSPQNRARATFLRGNVHARNRDFDRAIADFDQSIALSSREPGPYLNRGRVNYQRGIPERAIQDATTAINLRGDNPTAYLLRADAYIQRCEFDAAMADYDAALRLKSDLAGALGGRAALKLRRNEVDAALRDVEAALSAAPDVAVGYSMRGSIFARRGDEARALQDFDRAISMKADLASAYNNRGLIYARRGEIARAFQDFDAAVRLAPESFVNLFNRGKAHRQLGRHEQALADFKKALALPVKCSDDKAQRDDAQWRAGAIEAEMRDQSTPKLAPPAVPPTSVGSSDKRVALVIGNAGYVSEKPLRNPINDARAVAGALRRLGFSEVLEVQDASKERISAALRRFGEMASTADWAVVYYSGHGLQVDRTTYLVPIDARLQAANRIADELITLDSVLERLSRAKKLRLVILDACRNNPYAERLHRTASLTRSLGRGLARIDAPSGVLIAYAAREGQVADDGDGVHSPYTQALLEHIEDPGIDIDLMFRRVRDKVFSRTQHRDWSDPRVGGPQQPFTTGSLPGAGFCFQGPCAVR